MTRLYIIRHAEAEGNLYRRIHGWYDSLITDNGYRQIAALEHRFSDIHIDAVYSSDLYRTMTTAGAIYKPKGLTLNQLPALREMNLGAWEDKPWGEVQRFDGQRYALFDKSMPDWSVEGSETFTQLQTRMVEAVQTLASRHPGQNLALCSHGTAIRCLQAALHGLKLGELGALGHSDNTGVTCIEVDGGRMTLLFENDNSHLPEEISTLARQKWWKCGARGGLEPDANLWFRPLDVEREPAFYLQARGEAWTDIHGSDIPFDGDGFLRDARGHWAEDPKALACAMQGEEQAGLIQMNLSRDADKGIGYIPFVYMTPKHRKQGLGVQLLGQAISVYRPMGRKYLRLRCAPDNGVAQRFYKKYGFKKVGEEQGARVPLDILEKYIGYE